MKPMQFGPAAVGPHGGAAAILFMLGTALTAGAVEPQPEASADLVELAGQPVDMAPWAYAWQADREVQEKPEATSSPGG